MLGWGWIYTRLAILEQPDHAELRISCNGIFFNSRVFLTENGRTHPAFTPFSSLPRFNLVIAIAASGFVPFISHDFLSRYSLWRFNCQISFSMIEFGTLQLNCWLVFLVEKWMKPTLLFLFMTTQLKKPVMNERYVFDRLGRNFAHIIYTIDFFG